MITPYYGEFLIIPMPLELSLESCTNGCHYCFANLNKYTMKTSFQSVLNQLQKYKQRKGHAEFLLKNNYSICFSNRSDPFCARNYKNSVKLCELFTELGIDIAYQTKGGKGIDDVLGFINPSIWYITISQDDDNLRKQIEPNTISIKQRLRLIEKLVSKGHMVNVGINPFVPEWIKNKKRLVNDIKNAGCYGITLEGLHLSHEQARRLKPNAIDDKIIKRALKRNATDFEMSEYRTMCKIILESGMDLWSFWNEHISDLWEPYYQRYKCFPIITNFTNWVFKNKKEGDLITFEEFYKVMGGLPKSEFKTDSYIISINRSFRGTGILTKGTGKQLLEIFWSNPRLKTSPSNHPYLSIVGKLIDKNTIEITDEIPVYMYHKNNINSAFVTDQGEPIL